MLNEDIQFTILSHFYQLWLDNPWRKIDKLEEVNSSFEKPIEKTVLEANANFLKEKGWIAPPQTMGYSTNITIDGVLYLESIQYSDDIVIRDNILRRIGEEYEKNPLQYIRVNTIVEELGYSLNEIQRNLQIIDHLGLISFRRVANY